MAKRTAGEIRFDMYKEHSDRAARIEKEVKKRTKKTLIPKVTSLGDLLGKASLDPRYAQLALIASSNLGGGDNEDRWRDLAAVAKAIRWLRTNAQETSERGVLAEINGVRDLVTVT